MMNDLKWLLKWLLPAACLGYGAYLLRLSYASYGKWREHLAIGDHSGAEFYELNFSLEMPSALFLILLGMFLAGRWSVRKSKDK